VRQGDATWRMILWLATLPADRRQCVGRQL
jgi:hypothetical protein